VEAAKFLTAKFLYGAPGQRLAACKMRNLNFLAQFIKNIVGGFQNWGLDSRWVVEKVPLNFWGRFPISVQW